MTHVKSFRAFTLNCADCKQPFTVQRESIHHCPQRCKTCRKKRKDVLRYVTMEEAEASGVDVGEPNEACKDVIREIRAYVAHGYALRDKLRASCNAWARDHGLPEYRPPSLW